MFCAYNFTNGEKFGVNFYDGNRNESWKKAQISKKLETAKLSSHTVYERELQRRANAINAT